MENVVDSLIKEDGMYAKSAMGSLFQLNYQVRMGIIEACDQGVPQARNRSVDLLVTVTQFVPSFNLVCIQSRLCTSKQFVSTKCASVCHVLLMLLL